VTLSKKDGLKLEATVYLLGKTGTLALEKFIPAKQRREAVFSLTPSSPIEIPITPWKKISLDKFSLRLTPTIRELTTDTEIFGIKNTKITFGFEKTLTTTTKTDLEKTLTKPKKTNYAKIFFKELRLSSFFRRLKNSPFDEIGLTDVNFTIDNVLTKGSPKPVKLGCIIDFSKLDLPLPVKLSNLKTNIKLEKEKGLSLKTNLPLIKIGDFATLKNSTLEFMSPIKSKTQTKTTDLPEQTTTKKAITEPTQATDQPSLTLTGTAFLNLPLGIGKIVTQFNTKYQRARRSLEFLSI